MTTPWPTVTADLDESASVVLDSNGNGSVSFTPYGTRYSGYTWQPSMLFVSVATNVNEAQATAYVSYGVKSAQPSDAVGTTALGSTGDTCGLTQNLKPNDFITVAWVGGDAGSLATARLTGGVTVPIPTASR